ncbi:MAG: phytoene desaturase family protein [Solirubrobacteraceae bacterium]
MVDVLVIGAGHNGLTAGCFMRRAGLSVLVVEAAPEIGGMTATAPVIPGAPEHLVNTGALDATFIHATPVVEQLDLRRHGYAEVWVDPIWVYLHPGDASIALWRDATRTAQEIREFSRADARAYLDLAQTLDALLEVALPYLTAHPTRPGAKTLSQAALGALRRRRELPGVARLLGSSCAELIDGRFEHPIVRGALGSISAAFGPILDDGTAVVLLALGWYLRYGVSRPIGGTQTYPNALRSALLELGGTIRCDASVDEVILEGDRAVGVRLVDGEEIGARRAVLATCDPRTALEGLLPAGALDREMTARATAIPVYKDDLAPFRVDVALAGRLGFDRYERRRSDGVDLRIPGLFMGTLEAAIEAERAASAGRLPDPLNLYAGVPTGADPTQAPDGQDTLWLYVGPTPLHPIEGWEVLKPRATEATLARVGEFIDGVSALAIAHRAETPPEMAARLHAAHGCLWHVDLTLSRLGPLRPARGLAGYRTPVEGYYLGGAGSHPTPGMSSLPGRLAAAQIVRDANGSSPRSRVPVRRTPSEHPSVHV